MYLRPYHRPTPVGPITPFLRTSLLFTAVVSTIAAGADADQTLNTLDPVEVTAPNGGYSANSAGTATRTETPLIAIPQNVQVIPQALIQDQAAFTPDQALRNIAGVQADFGFNGTAMPIPILRGFPSVSMTANGQMSGGETYYIDGSKLIGVPINMADVASIDVVKGPASVLYGRSEPGGLVNVIPRGVPQGSGASVSQTIGSYRLSRTEVEGYGALDDANTLRLRVTGSWYQTDSIRDYVQDQVGGLSAALEWTPDARNSVKALVSYSDDRYRTDYGVPEFGGRPADLPWSAQFNNSPALSSARSTSLRLDIEHHFDDDWRLKVHLLEVSELTSEVDVGPYRVDLVGSGVPGYACPGDGTILCRYYFNVRPNGRYSFDEASADLEGHFGPDDWRHTVLVGIDDYYSNKRGLQYFAQVTAVGVVPLQTPPPVANLDPNAASVIADDDYNHWSSLYVQDELAVHERVFVVAGLRHDVTSASFAAIGTPPNDLSFTTPRAGIVWQFKPGQALYAQWQEAVAANNGLQVNTNQPLPAERSHQWEVGHKLIAPDGSLESTVAIYQLFKNNRASQVPAAVAPFYTVETIGEARSEGLEWDMRGHLGARWTWLTSYAYTETLVTQDPIYQGDKLANVARHAGSAWVKYAWRSEWSAGGGIFAQSQRQGDIGNDFQLPGYARFDVMAAHDLGLQPGRLHIQFNVDNIFDRKYYSASHQYSQDWIKLGEPRTFKLGVRWDV